MILYILLFATIVISQKCNIVTNYNTTVETSVNCKITKYELVRDYCGGMTYDSYRYRYYNWNACNITRYKLSGIINGKYVDDIFDQLKHDGWKYSNYMLNCRPNNAYQYAKNIPKLFGNLEYMQKRIESIVDKEITCYNNNDQWYALYDNVDPVIIHCNKRANIGKYIRETIGRFIDMLFV